MLGVSSYIHYNKSSNRSRKVLYEFDLLTQISQIL